MSAVLPRAVDGARAADDAGAGSTALPPTITDAQGRVFALQQDPVTGSPQYRHAAQQRDAAGSTLDLEILITLAADGSFTRRTSQQLNLATGDAQTQVQTTAHAADGTQTGETVESTSRTGSARTSERTVGTYQGGQLVRRETDITQSDEATDATTGEHTRVEAKIHGTWFDEGRPITDTVVPHVDRTETQTYRTPGEGLYKDTDRTLTFTRHGSGPVSALQWDEQGALTVRFEGRSADRYLERELRVPLAAADGAPQMDRAETVRTDDRQNLVNKGLMQARIWGGLASNLAWIVGLNFARGGLGMGFLGLSAASAGAQFTGEVHAVATGRNDGDWGRVLSSGYDLLLTGAIAAYKTGQRRNVAGQQQLTGNQQLTLNAAGAAGLAMNGAELVGPNAIGSRALASSIRDSVQGLQQASSPAAIAPATSSATGGLAIDRDFDAVAALQ